MICGPDLVCLVAVGLLALALIIGVVFAIIEKGGIKRMSVLGAIVVALGTAIINKVAKKRKPRKKGRK